MTKEELVFVTIRQLNNSLKISPENFKLEENSGNFCGPTVIWTFKVKLDEDRYIADPLNSTKTVIVTYNNVGRELFCYIYNREVINFNQAIMPDVKASIKFNTYIPLSFYRSFREFMNLKQSLLKQRDEKEFTDYMKKLATVFPTVSDDDLFK